MRVPSAAGHVGTPIPDDELIALTDEVWARLHARVEQPFARLEIIVSALFDRRLEPAEVAEALGLADRIATKLGTLGFASAADLIRQAAGQLESTDLGLSNAIGMASLIDDARTAVAATVAELRVMAHSSQRIAVVGPATEVVDEVIWLALTQGIAVDHHVDGVSPTEHDTAAVVVSVGDPDLSRSRPLVRSVRELYTSQPMIMVAPSGNLAQRSRMVDSVTTVLDCESHPAGILDEVRASIHRAAHEPTLSVFGSGAEWLVEHLGNRGFTARVESSADSLLQSVQAGESRAVILTPETGPIKPFEILRMIRTDRQLRGAVVIAISDRTNPAHRHTALREGVDDIVPTDIDLDDLAVLIKARLQRRAVLEPIQDNTMKTGAVPWDAAVVLIERMLTVAFRRNAPVGVAYLRFDSPEDAAESRDLDSSIAREFRQEDVVARVDEQHLVIALRGVNRQTLMRRMAELHHKFGLHERAGRISGVEFPVDGRSLDELLENAKRTLNEAEANDGPAVTGFDWKPERSGTTDVLLVDPDETLGTVLSATLARRGLRVTQQPDSLDALSLLTGHDGDPLPRLVLTELDLRGIDGLQFLRQIREAGTMSRFKVVVLSARASESDMRQAFDLGIDDFVPKPFSTPLLLHRVTRLLES